MKTRKHLAFFLTLALLIFIAPLNFTPLHAAGVGSTIAETITDPVLATEVAKRLGTDVNHVITDEDVNKLTTISYSGSNAGRVASIEGLGTFTNLSSVALDYNALTDFPAVVNELTGAQKLEFLKLNSNDMTGGIPEAIGNFTNLEYLQLNLNQKLGGPVPESFGNLTKLNYFNVTNTGVTSLPDSIGNLTVLNDLFVYGNKFDSLPDSIMQLENLTTVNVGYNRIIDLPQEQYDFLTSVQTHTLNGQSNEQDAPTVAIVGQDFELPAFPIYAQSNNYIDAKEQRILFLKNPSGVWINWVGPDVPADGILTLPADAITEAGDYEFQFYFPETSSKQIFPYTQLSSRLAP